MNVERARPQSLNEGRDRLVTARAFTALAFTLLSAFVLLRLSAYGIWDPWELGVAEHARKLAEGSSAASPPNLALRLVSAAFALLGEREWVGRLPFALCGVGLLVTTGLTAFRFAGLRVALYALLALGTTPLFLLHSRQMLGATPTFLASSLVLLGASSAVFPDREGRHPSARAVAGWLALAVLGALLGTWAAGAMLAVVPPLGAVALAALIMGGPTTKRELWVRHGVIAAGLLVAALVTRAIMKHEAAPSLWTGGAPLDASVPSFERVLEHVFHGMAPWSALFPVALAALLVDDDAPRPDQALRIICMLWAALGYAAETVFLSSYGAAPFPAAAALALAVAFWLHDRNESAAPFWPELVVSLLFLGLIVRDYALYPASPWGHLELSDTKPPEVFNPRVQWVAVLGLFGAGLAVSCMAHRHGRALDLRAPYRGLVDLWRRSIGHKVWLVLAALLALFLLAFGAVAWLKLSSIRLTSLGVRIGRVGFFVPLAVPVLLALGQVVYALCPELAARRHAVLFVGALAVGAYTSQVFLPAASEHFSPREVFDTYNKLAGPNEPLAQHKVEGRAASYYAKGEVRDITSRSELLEFLSQNGRRWAAFPSDQLADIDVAFRKRTGRHLFVPATDNARVTLVANEPVKNERDHNPLSRFVLSSLPPVEHKVGAVFDDAVELVGYNLSLPRKDHVGPGQAFEITWVWRALRENLGSYKVFVHIDSGSQRINGDHDPVDGKYPVRLWDKGDVILDRQSVSVPATSPPGVYTMYIGLYRGESRLRVKTGEHDGSNRVRAGTVRVE